MQPESGHAEWLLWVAKRRSELVGQLRTNTTSIGLPQSNGMDAPTLNGIKRAKVEVSATT
jgi:hypothetical protein